MPPRRSRGSPAASSPANKKAKAGDEVKDTTPAGVPSVVLIGMRGAGKTSLGVAAAGAIGGTFLDMDWVYEATHGPIKDTVASEGWPTFRAREVELLRATLEEKSTGHVIACGGGIVETEEGRELLRNYFPVVQVRREGARELSAWHHTRALSLSHLSHLSSSHL